MRTVIIIPARYDSTRFPGKALHPILGKPMIQHVYERASLVEDISGVYVATDSEKIFQCVEAFGGRPIMTDSGHLSGSDRLAEASQILELAPEDIVINVQGDQPALNPTHPKLLEAALLERGSNYPVSTLAVHFTSKDEIDDPNHVKVVIAFDGRALYFSRSRIPYGRVGEGTYYKHIGLYAYYAGFLREFVSLKEGFLEKTESLEQLRILEHGFPIKVMVQKGASPEVDVPSDVEKVEKILRDA
ncbi:MAG: 3-deoxy-manno-octulosonate cytidylyltransferase [Deltaproteobacteria bacterium]|jgi:3-deoxy-manno-octulosonate cytidylyltransferase (CMP-KDO synthetase)|nr:3-deoxy-manno-octulosonate cytidylyltransferase [Deltaproteobacteria bacterium]